MWGGRIEKVKTTPHSFPTFAGDGGRTVTSFFVMVYSGFTITVAANLGAGDNGFLEYGPRRSHIAPALLGRVGRLLGCIPPFAQPNKHRLSRVRCLLATRIICRDGVTVATRTGRGAGCRFIGIHRPARCSMRLRTAIPIFGGAR